LKLCTQCRWIRPQADGSKPLCGHPTSVAPAYTSPVDGQISPAYRYACSDMRFFLAGLHCGEEGKYWEPADPTPPGFV
jgi:hypothetical protein